MPRRNLIWLTGMGCLSLFLWAVAQGSIVPPRGPLQFVKGFPGKDDDYEGLALMVDVWRTVRQNYVQDLDAKQSREFWDNAVHAGVHGLDEHSGYYPPKHYEEFNKQSEASFPGIGVRIDTPANSKKWIIVSPIVGSPALRAGIKAGDEIIKVGDTPVAEMKPEEATKRIQGPPGTTIALTIHRPRTGKTFELNVTREVVEIESVLGDHRDANHKWDYFLSKQDGIAYIRLTEFTQRTTKEMKAALDQLNEQGVKGLILDLRGNGGGLLRSAVDIANMFISKGVLVTVDGRTHAKEEYKADPKNVILPTTPLVVLIDDRSASASEILAAALQDHQRAKILGERSYGKGSVQNVFPLENGKSGLKLTTARYIRPNGKNIHRTKDLAREMDWGVTPDMEFKVGPDEKVRLKIERDDLDIIRDPLTPDELRRETGEVLMALGAASAFGIPGCDASFAAADLLVAHASLHHLPRTIHDPMRDRAVEILMKDR